MSLFHSVPRMENPFLKTWQILTSGIFIGLLAAGFILLVSAPPRAQAIILLPTKTPRPWVVHLTGAVANPGVYEIASDSRLRDVIALAGGALPQADLEAVNLAARLGDGVKIRIPFQGETPVAPLLENPTLPESPKETSGINVNLIDINHASAEQLEALPGIGKTRADAIVEYRQSHGNFDTIEQIQNVPGIGPAIFEQIRGLIMVTP